MIHYSEGVRKRDSERDPTKERGEGYPKVMGKRNLQSESMSQVIGGYSEYREKEESRTPSRVLA